MTRNRHRIYSPPQSEPELERIADEIVERTPDKVVHKNFDGGSSHEVHVQLKVRTQAISIGIPMDELMFSQFLMNFVGLHLMPWDQLITTTSTYLPLARNNIHNMFLESKGHSTHLLMLDSDVLPPPDIIESLLIHNKPIVGGWYKKKEKYPFKGPNGETTVIQRPVVYDWNDTMGGYTERTGSGQGLEQVRAAGAGCWLMTREVAEKLGKSPYGDTMGAGEDLHLCTRLTELGIPIYVDWELPCAHAGVFFV
jgi:hypothetical protein